MMRTLFNSLQVLFVNWAAQGLVLGLGVLVGLAAARFVRKKLGAAWLCRQWLVFALLFLMPVRFLLPTLPSAVPVQQVPAQWYEPVTVAEPQTEPAVERPAADAAQQRSAAVVSVSPRRTVTPLQCLTAGWLAGAAVVLGWQVTSYRIWRRRALRSSAAAEDGWRCDGLTVRATPMVRSPLLVGMLRPVLLVPPGTAPQGAAYILAHEQAHLRRHDVAFKGLLLLVCAVHWYNPAVWLLQHRAARDIESACDAAVLQNRSDDYRAAYADALLEAVRQSRGPVLTSCFALSKKQFRERLAAVWDTSPKPRGRLNLVAVATLCLWLATLAACQTRDPSEPIREEVQSGAVILAMEPVEVPQGGEPEARAILAATQFVREPLVNNVRSDPEHTMGIYLAPPSMIGTLADPDEGTAAGDVGDLVDSATLLVETPEGSRTIRECLAMPGYYLVKVSYTIYYTPEVLYLGPQYSDGARREYILVCVTGEQPACLNFSGPYADGEAAGEPNQTAEAKALRLSTRQYLMLEHQAKALYRAGIGSFAGPSDWTDDQLTRYLYYRSRDYLGDHDWMVTNLMLTVDFTAQDNWSFHHGFVTVEWSGVDETVWSQCESEPWPEPAELQFTANGDGTITALTDRARYTFRVYNGGDLDWSARTYCIGGEALS